MRRYEVKLSIWYIDELEFEAIDDRRAFRESTWLHPRRMGYNIKDTNSVRDFLDTRLTFDTVAVKLEPLEG